MLRNQRSSVRYSDVSPKSKASRRSPASVKESAVRDSVDVCRGILAYIVVLGVVARRT
jgi:hypothetical protein